MPKVPPGSQAPAANDVDLKDITLLETFAEQYPHIANESRLRWLIYRRKSNGIEASGALLKRGGRWYVVTPRLRDWLLQDEGA